MTERLARKSGEKLSFYGFLFPRSIFFTAFSCRSISRKKRFSFSSGAGLSAGAVDGEACAGGGSFVGSGGGAGRVESRVLRNSGKRKGVKIKKSSFFIIFTENGRKNASFSVALIDDLIYNRYALILSENARCFRFGVIFKESKDYAT